MRAFKYLRAQSRQSIHAVGRRLARRTLASSIQESTKYEHARGEQIEHPRVYEVRTCTRGTNPKPPKRLTSSASAGTGNVTSRIISTLNELRLRGSRFVSSWARTSRARSSSI